MKMKKRQTNQPIDKSDEGKKTTKKKFVKPAIKAHEKLPEITTAFIGTYQP